MNPHRQDGKKKQGGVALIVALVLIVLASLLGAAGYMVASGEARGALGWSDRQRALFIAESALREAEQVLGEKLAGASDITANVRASGVGYYVRSDGNVPGYNPWEPKKSLQATAIDKRVAGAAYYMIVFEGMAPDFGAELVGANGAANPANSMRARFTIYARAGGIREGTDVTLMASREY